MDIRTLAKETIKNLVQSDDLECAKANTDTALFAFYIQGMNLKMCYLNNFNH